MREQQDEKQVEAFRTLAQSVLGENWIFRLASFAGVATRTAQRWSAGTSPVPPGVINDLKLQRHLLDQVGLERKAEDLAREAMAAGVSQHVVSAQLREIGDRLKPKDQDDNP